jgi:hypothetical protein
VEGPLIREMWIISDDPPGDNRFKPLVFQLAAGLSPQELAIIFKTHGGQLRLSASSALRHNRQ